MRHILGAIWLILLTTACALGQSASVKIWDGTRTAHVTGTALDVNATLDTTGLATSAKQDTGNASLSSIDGKITACNTGAVVVSSGSLTCNAGTNLNTSALATEVTLSALNGKVIDSTPYSFGALVDTVQTVKGAAGTLTGWYLFNPAATACYVQIFNVSGAVTLGATAPTLSLGIPAGSAANIPAGIVGIAFTNAIKIASTTTRAGNTPCGTGSDVNFWYK